MVAEGVREFEEERQRGRGRSGSIGKVPVVEALRFSGARPARLSVVLILKRY